MSKEKELTHEDVKKIVSSYMNEEHVALVEKAYHFAEVAHHDQRRKSGEPYIIHPIQVAGHKEIRSYQVKDWKNE